MSEDIADYEGYDFKGQWSGRAKVTEVERHILKLALKDEVTERVLEAGFGFGRLFESIRDISDEYYGLDINRDAFRGFEKSDNGGKKTTFVVGNLYNLPFADNSFSAAVMWRVHHHLGDPLRALKELSRVVVSNGTVLVWYNPRPSVATAVIDMKSRFSGKSASRNDLITLQKKPFIKVAEDPFPVFSSTRESFHLQIEQSGMEIIREYPMGFEDFFGLSSLPLRFLRNIPVFFRRIPYSPAVLVKAVARKEQIDGMRKEEDVICCPRCRSKISSSSGNSTDNSRSEYISCPSCDFRGEISDGIWNLKFID